MVEQILNLLKEEDGQGMVEYGIILALVAVVCIAAVTRLGGEAEKTFGTTADKLQGVNNGGNGGQ